MIQLSSVNSNPLNVTVFAGKAILKRVHIQPFIMPWMALLLVICLMLTCKASRAESAPTLEQLRQRPVPVWVFHDDNFEFYYDSFGNLKGLYPQLIDTLNRRYQLKLYLAPISGEEISAKFNNHQPGMYAGVLRTEARSRSRSHQLSARLFDNEVVVASLNAQIYEPEDLKGARVAYREHDATRPLVETHYPALPFHSIREVKNNQEAFDLLLKGDIDFYINDASEMNDLPRELALSRPFPLLKLASVYAFSPDLIALRQPVNNLISSWSNSGYLNRLIKESKRGYLSSQLKLTPTEKQWIANNTLDIWLPKQENFAPFIWRENNRYYGSAINIINDLRELTGVKINIHFIPDYLNQLRQNQWPIRLVNLNNNRSGLLDPGNITPMIRYRNVYYNQIGRRFLWEEERLRHRRVAVLRNSFSSLYLKEHFGGDVELVQRDTIDELLDTLKKQQADFILGDLSSIETSLRGDEVFRGVLKVAGITHSEFTIGSWVDPNHPLHDLLARISVISQHRAQLDPSGPVPPPAGFTKNTFKVLMLVAAVVALFACILLMMAWRQVLKNRRVHRNIVVAMEQVNRAHDDDTGNHISRVSRYCGLLAKLLGLSHKMATEIETYASLHDVGKIGVPDRILRKQGPLDEAEFEEMKQHVFKGWQILRELKLGPVAENIVHYHHEKWDGSGYPKGLSGSAIPIEARILALADVYDALRQQRVYKPGFNHEKACEIILAGAGKHFDPELVNLFRRHHHKFEAIFDANAD